MSKFLHDADAAATADDNAKGYDNTSTFSSKTAKLKFKKAKASSKKHSHLKCQKADNKTDISKVSKMFEKCLDRSKFFG